MAKKIKCFVAMAFDKPDIDSIFQRYISPELLKNGITPIRMDEIQHNEDINLRLITEMNECAFGIADLTYARPSVYYEAGFISANKEILYTCRRDHFKNKIDTKGEDNSIHFDLKMKNIIAWDSAIDNSKFLKKLSKMIRVHFSPLVRNLEKSLKNVELEQSFKNKSQVTKISLLQKGAEDLLVSEKCSRLNGEIEDRGWVLGIRKFRGKKIKIRIKIFNDFNVWELKNTVGGSHFGQRGLDADPKSGRAVFSIIVALNRVQKKHLGKHLPQHSVITKNTYLYSYYFKDDIKQRMYKSFYSFFDDVKSENVFSDIKLEIDSLLKRVK